MKIYKMPTVEIPTNVPMVRADQNDAIYKTKDGKWKAVVNEVEAAQRQGQPVLVGTISVETSEMLSGELKRRGIEHVVLNAKPEHAEREGETIAQAGRRARSRSPPTWPAAASTSSSAATPSRWRAHELDNRGIKPGDDGYEESSAASSPPSSSRRPRPRRTRSGSSAGSTSAAPSATSRGASTTSFAAARAARATPASRASSSPPRTT